MKRVWSCLLCPDGGSTVHLSGIGKFEIYCRCQTDCWMPSHMDKWAQVLLALEARERLKDVQLLTVTSFRLVPREEGVLVAQRVGTFVEGLCRASS